MTGEPEKVTLQMAAPRPLTTGDVMFAVGKLSRAAGFEPDVGKISIAQDPTIAVFDMSTKAAEELVTFSEEQNLESVNFVFCSDLPKLQTVQFGVRIPYRLDRPPLSFLLICDLRPTRYC